jgi:hypothetical protein
LCYTITSLFIICLNLPFRVDSRVIECRNPTLREVWGCHPYSQNGTWKSFGTLKNLECNCRGQNTSHWSVLYTVRKFLKYRCPKWLCMSHWDICSISYGRKKGWESNWQFGSQPLKVGNWPDLDACKWSATNRWKALEESYNFGLDLVPIWAWGEKLWMPKVPSVATSLWAKWEDETPTHKVGDLESSRTPECLEFNNTGQNTSHQGVLGVIGKVLKCRCPKWPRISHLDICRPSYGQKKGRESNW